MMYKEDPAWADVVPIFNSDVENSVVPINYTSEFAEVFAYFRAVLKLDERSERAFQLTTDAARLNPANYTVWQYRRNLITFLGKDLADELKFAQSIIEDSPKNYQVWHHRSVILNLKNDPAGELDFIALVLSQDSKNYHAWQHRQWVVSKFNLWDDEMDFVNHLLSEDLRNNSAWNYRYFLINNTTGFTEEVLNREVKIAMEFAKKAPHNESVWNYLNGILMHESGGAAACVGLLDFCEELYDDPKCRANHLLLFMVEQLGDKGADRSQQETDRALALLSELDVIDPIRKGYWQYLRSSLFS